VTSAEDDSGARTTVPTEARTALWRRLCPSGPFPSPPLSFPAGLHNLPHEAANERER